MQNGVSESNIGIPSSTKQGNYTVFMFRCSFRLYWDGLGSGVQYSQAQIIVKDATNKFGPVH